MLQTQIVLSNYFTVWLFKNKAKMPGLLQNLITWIHHPLADKTMNEHFQIHECNRNTL